MKVRGLYLKVLCYVSSRRGASDGPEVARKPTSAERKLDGLSVPVEHDVDACERGSDPANPLNSWVNSSD